MLSQVVINQGNFDLQNRAENVVQTVVHCFSIISTNKLKINKITPLSQGPLGSRKGSEEHRKALKSVDFQCFFFLVKLQDNAEYYLQACTKRVHRVSCTKMYTVTRKGPQQVEDCAFAEIQL